MISEILSTPSEAQVSNHPAQRGPDEASERPPMGWVSSQEGLEAGPHHLVTHERPERRGVGGAPTGRTPPLLGSYRISHSNPVEKFKKYLKKTHDYQFRITGTSSEGEVVVVTVPYIHRWTEVYHKSILAKFYTLDEWMKDYPGVVTMFTLTTYQGSKSKFNDGSLSREVKGHDLTIFECFDLLKISRTKFLNVLRNRYPGINYVWVLEPHETGFPHCHLVVFREFTEQEQTFIKELWSEKYQAGSYDRGIEVSSKTSDESIKSIRNYLMKYMTKQFGTGEQPWTKGEFLFNAMVWKTGTRMWGASKELTDVMRRPEKISDIIWDTVELLIPSRGVSILELLMPSKGIGNGSLLVWSREDKMQSPLDIKHQLTEQNLDDLCPEGYVTRRFWEDKYWSIEQWRKELKYH